MFTMRFQLDTHANTLTINGTRFSLDLLDYTAVNMTTVTHQRSNGLLAFGKGELRQTDTHVRARTEAGQLLICSTRMVERRDGEVYTPAYRGNMHVERSGLTLRIDSEVVIACKDGTELTISSRREVFNLLTGTMQRYYRCPFCGEMHEGEETWTVRKARMWLQLLGAYPLFD
jgi:hypothetical protein